MGDEGAVARHDAAVAGAAAERSKTTSLTTGVPSTPKARVAG
jgi:hypothetical protein